MQKVKNIQKRKRIRHRISFLAIAGLLGIVIAACVSTITNINQPNEVNAGDTAKIVLSIQWKETNEDHTDRQVIGICVPKSWNAANNARVHVEGDVGDASMSVVPASAVEPDSKLPWKDAFMKKFGIGPNLIEDMEWVVYWSDVKFSVPNQSLVNGKVYINIKTGPANLQFKPGYAMCEDKDGLSDFFSGYYTSAFGTCLAVVNGEGDEIQDFCNPQIGIGEPSNALSNDIITLKYDGNLDISTLPNESEIYLCSKAYTTDGEVLENCVKDESNLLRPFAFKKWRVDFWPAKHLSVPAGKELQRLEYYFTDKTGTIKTGFANTANPFVYSFKCK